MTVTMIRARTPNAPAAPAIVPHSSKPLRSRGITPQLGGDGSTDRGESGDHAQDLLASRAWRGRRVSPAPNAAVRSTSDKTNAGVETRGRMCLRKHSCSILECQGLRFSGYLGSPLERGTQLQEERFDVGANGGLVRQTPPLCSDESITE